MNRSALIQGPAKVIFNAPSGAVTFHTADDIGYDIIQRQVPIRTTMHGEIDQRDSDMMLECSVKPDGRFDAALIAALWPYSNSAMGAPLWSDTDRTLVFHGTDGALHTWAAAAVTKMPDLLFSAVATMVGEVGFTGLTKNGSTWATANRLLTIAAGASAVDSTFTVAGIKTQTYTAALGAVAGLTAIESLDGFRVSFALELDDLSTDSLGVYQKTIRNVGIAVRCTPIQPTSAQLLTALNAQETGTKRGQSLDAGSAALTIVGADTVTYLTIPRCSIRTGRFQFGSSAQQLRVGEVAFVATRAFSSGAQQALWTLAAS